MLFCNILSFVHELYAYCEALWDNLQLIHCFYVWMFLKLVWSFLFCTLKAALEENILYCCSLLNCSIAFFFCARWFYETFFHDSQMGFDSVFTHAHTPALTHQITYHKYLNEIKQQLWRQTYMFLYEEAIYEKEGGCHNHCIVWTYQEAFYI